MFALNNLSRDDNRQKNTQSINQLFLSNQCSQIKETFLSFFLIPGSSIFCYIYHLFKVLLDSIQFFFFHLITLVLFLVISRQILNVYLFSLSDIIKMLSENSSSHIVISVFSSLQYFSLICRNCCMQGRNQDSIFTIESFKIYVNVPYSFGAFTGYVFQKQKFYCII